MAARPARKTKTVTKAQAPSKKQAALQARARPVSSRKSRAPNSQAGRKPAPRRPGTLSPTVAVEWTASVPIPGGDTAKQAIETKLDSKRKQWAIWLHRESTGNDIYYSKRRLRKPWRPAAQLLPVIGVQEIAFAITPDDVKLIVWQEFRAGGIKRVAIAEFTDAVGEPFYFPNKDGQFDAFPHVAASADNTRHVVFGHGNRIVYAASRNGKRWKSEYVTGTEFNRPRIAIDDSTGTVYIGYMRVPEKDLFVVSRSPADPAWSTPKFLGVGQDMNLVARDGKLMASWGNDSETGGRLAIRTLENGRWSKKMSPDGLPFASYNPHGALDSQGNPHLIWSQSVDGKNEYDIWYSDFSGGQWTPALPLQVTGGMELGNDLAIDPSDGLHAVMLNKNPIEVAFSADRPSATAPSGPEPPDEDDL